jgi:hypothetical protein
VGARVPRDGRQFPRQPEGLGGVGMLEPDLQRVDAGAERGLDRRGERMPGGGAIGDEREAERDQRPGTPSIGDEAVAYSFIGIRPAS